MIYIKGLDFEEKPNYDMIRGKFKSVLMRLHTNRKEEVPLAWKIIRDKKREDKRLRKSMVGDLDTVKDPSQKMQLDVNGFSGPQ
jgi:uncharacterized protein YbaA (DUF1428 family)